MADSAAASRRSSATKASAFETVDFAVEFVVKPTDEAYAAWGSGGSGRVPFFRFTFPTNGDHTTTQQLNEAQWTKEGGAAPAAAEGDDAEDGGDKDGKAEGKGAETAPGFPEAPQFRFSKEVKAVKMTEDQALALAANPIMNVFMGDVLVGKAGGEDGGDDDGEGSGNGGAGRRTRYFADGFSTCLDLSAFLDDDLMVDVVHASDDVASQVLATDGKTAANRLALAPPGIDRLEVRVTVSKPVLTREMRQSLNPLSITMRRLIGLPGIVMADGDPSLSRFVTPSKYTLLQKFCKPMYLVYTFFDGDAWPRVVRTPGYRNGEGALLNHKSVFLTGTLTEDEVTEHIVTAPIKIEVHDRDPMMKPEDRERQVERWEGYVDGTWVEPIEEDPEMEATGGSKGTAAVAGGGGDAAGDAAGEASGAEGSGGEDGGARGGAAGAAGEPVGKHEPYEVDAMASQELEQELLRAGDSCAHGVAAFRLDKLLDRGQERLAILKHKEAVRQAKEAAAQAVVDEARAKKQRRKERRRRRAAGLDADPDTDEDEGKAESKTAAAGEGKEDGGDGGEDGAGDSGADGAADGGANEGSVAGSVAASRRGSEQGRARATGGDDGLPFIPYETMTASETVDVVAAKRRVIPKGGEVLYDISEEQRVSRQPGQYQFADSRVKVAVRLARPLHSQPPTQRPKPMPFERAVFCMRYRDDSLLRRVVSELKQINTEAIPDILSIRSHQLTPQQREACDAGELDILSGFQVVDDNWRIVVVEGLGDGAMKRLRHAVGRDFFNTPTVKCMANPSLRFRRRMYTAFDVAPKDIRLREPLGRIIKQPDIYNRSKVSAMTFDCLHRLFEIRHASRLVELKANQFFPTAEMLLDLENKYGDTVTVQDMEGGSGATHAARGGRARAAGGRAGAGGVGAGGVGTGGQGGSGGGGAGDGAGDGAGVGNVEFAVDAAGAPLPAEGASARRRREHREALSTTNPEFEQSRRNRSVKNYLAENKTAVAGAGEGTGRPKVRSLDIEGKEPPGGQVFMYSGQKLNTTEWQKDMMRKRLAKDKKATYTYSSEYQSLTVCLVNEAEIARDEAAAKKKKWTTQQGFVYPAPREPAEFSKHPRAPSGARAEELAQPWVENEVLEATKARPDHLGGSGKADFDSVPLRNSEFGYVDAEGTKNPDFFKSVHLTGDGLAAEAAAAKLRQEKEWNDKVVVDNVRFLPHYTAKKSSQLGKVESMLKGEVKKKALRIVHNATLPSGKKTAPPTAAPVAMLAGEEYEDPKDFTLTLKPNDPAHFAGTDEHGNPGHDFQKFIHPDRMKPKAQTLLARRKIPELSDAEKVGPRWYDPPAKPPVKAPVPIL